jgi:hypothetical protein
VIELDNNDELYRQMQREPWLIDDKLNTYLDPTFAPLAQITLQSHIDGLIDTLKSQDVEKSIPNTQKTNAEDSSPIETSSDVEKSIPNTQKTNAEDSSPIETSSDDWTLTMIILIVCAVIIICVSTVFYYRRTSTRATIHKRNS